MEMLWYVVYAGIVVVGCAVAANRLLKVGHALRERALFLSNMLLSDDRFPASLKAEISGIVPHLADYATAWQVVMAVLLLPFHRHPLSPDTEIVPELVRPWRDLQRASIIAALTNSLAATLVFLVLVACITYLVAFNLISYGWMRKLTVLFVAPRYVCG